MIPHSMHIPELPLKSDTKRDFPAISTLGKRHRMRVM
jgi:hypothetical protein